MAYLWSDLLVSCSLKTFLYGNAHFISMCLASCNIVQHLWPVERQWTVLQLSLAIVVEKVDSTKM
jgi:hypothetical protein